MPTLCKDVDGNIITQQPAVLEMWTEYVGNNIKISATYANMQEILSHYTDRYRKKSRKLTLPRIMMYTTLFGI